MILNPLKLLAGFNSDFFYQTNHLIKYITKRSEEDKKKKYGRGFMLIAMKLNIFSSSFFYDEIQSSSNLEHQSMHGPTSFFIHLAIEH